MSDMPDFDSMTPEEMMKWMESLAKRQGATEGLTTDADMEVAEVSADDERLAGKGDYVPYGWTEDKWKEHLAKEEEQKKAKQQQPAASAPTPAPSPTPPAPAPEPIPAPQPVAQAPEPAPQAAASATPDFDSMTPEELMKWMESLAKRQGATEGLITSADMAVEEVAADDERLAGKGDYVPYGWTEDKWKEHLAKEEEQKKAKQQGAVASSPAPQPVAQTPEPSFDLGSFEEVEETVPLEPVAENPMDWLSSLGAPDESLPTLDLNLDALGNLAGTPSSQGSDDPMAWLEGLSDNTSDDALASLSALGNADNNEGSLEWMESLASRQGAPDEELITAADLNLPFPSNLDETGPGYEEFSFEHGTGIQQDNEPVAAKAGANDFPELDLENPEDWLDSLASGGNIIGDFDDEEEDFDFGEEEEEEVKENFDAIAVDVKAKLDKGIASPEEIETFFMHAFSKADNRRDVADYIDSDDEDEDVDVPMPVQAEIPDWLKESMETVSVDEAAETETQEAPRKGETGEMMIAALGLDEEIPADIPDWLTAGMNEDTGTISADIFDFTIEDEESPDKSATPAFALDTEDSWVEAFSQEASGELAQWYEGAVANLEGGAPVPASSASAGAVSLQAANLPDESLPHGSPMRVPEWLGGAVPVSSVENIEIEAPLVNDMDWLTTDEAAAVEADMPDWLRGTVDDSVAVEEDLPEWLQGENLDIAPEEVPDWLRETMDEEEEVNIVPEPVQTKPSPVPAQKPVMPVPVASSPAPVPVAAANINVAAILQEAQQKISGGDIDGGLLAYEQVVRANASLPQVEAALQKLADDKNHKGNPAISRVLGDTLMRQGKLQQALDTYRKALNML